MGAWPWSKPLEVGMRPNPVMELKHVPLVDIHTPTDTELKTLFSTSKSALKTWNRSPGVKCNDAHWIGVHRGTNLHYDPGYPRYTHHLLVRVDNGYYLRGLNLVETPKLRRGMCMLIDTHSPHQLKSAIRSDLWYVAASIDDDVPHSAAEMVPWLVRYCRENSILNGRPV